MPANDHARTPTDLPGFQAAHVPKDSLLYRKVHQVTSTRLAPSDIPRFTGKPVWHWWSRQCDKASLQQRTKFYGKFYNRIEVCPCGRDRTWPQYSDEPASSWLGKTGRAGRRFWSHREIVGTVISK